MGFKFPLEASFISISKIRIMSINRKGSKATLRLAPEDLAASLDQKNSIIVSLQGELQKLRSNQERFDRVKEELTKGRFRYECLLRDQQSVVSNNEERLELSVRNVQELRIQSDHVAQELRLKAQMLKEIRSKTQELIEFSNRKEDESAEIKIKLQEQKSSGEVLRVEEERSRIQIGQLREEVQKTRRENGAVRTQNDLINEKCFKTQSYIRGLLREEANLNESLVRIEDENAKLDNGISELDTLISINDGSISEKEKDCQELIFAIASKELDKKKIENEGREKVKQLSAEKQKWRLLWEQWEQKRQEGARIDAHLSEATAEISFILSKNNEIMEVNEKLGEDLKVCQRHQQNVQRINKNLDSEIQSLKETNLKAISKLQEPFSNMTNQPFPNPPTYAKWSTSSRATEYETGQFDRRSQRA